MTYPNHKHSQNFLGKDCFATVKSNTSSWGEETFQVAASTLEIRIVIVNSSTSTSAEHAWSIFGPRNHEEECETIFIACWQPGTGSGSPHFLEVKARNGFQLWPFFKANNAHLLKSDTGPVFSRLSSEASYQSDCFPELCEQTMLVDPPALFAMSPSQPSNSSEPPTKMRKTASVTSTEEEQKCDSQAAPGQYPADLSARTDKKKSECTLKVKNSRGRVLPGQQSMIRFLAAPRFFDTAGEFLGWVSRT